jgi:hypothetical protein
VADKWRRRKGQGYYEETELNDQPGFDFGLRANDGSNQTT